MKFHRIVLSLLFLTLCLPGVYADVVQVEIIQLDGASIEHPHTWGRELVKTDAPAVQFRNQRPGDAVSITESGTEAMPIWKVIGTMDAYGTILMPDGAQFRCGDSAGLARWIRELPLMGKRFCRECYKWRRSKLVPSALPFFDNAFRIRRR